MTDADVKLLLNRLLQLSYLLLPNLAAQYAARSLLPNLAEPYGARSLHPDLPEIW